MKLCWIVEGPNSTLKPLLGKPRFQQLRQSLDFMPGRKVRHSLRVGATAAKSGLAPEYVEAAILHDYIERGGDLTALDRLEISPRARRIIHMLSVDEKTSGVDDTSTIQQHIEHMLNDQTIDPHEKDVAIIVKCADRLDNLKKRIKGKRLNSQYATASLKLFQTLLGSYQGDPVHARHVTAKIAKLDLGHMNA